MLRFSQQNKNYLQFFEIKSIKSYLVYKFYPKLQPKKESNLIKIPFEHDFLPELDF